MHCVSLCYGQWASGRYSLAILLLHGDPHGFLFSLKEYLFSGNPQWDKTMGMLGLLEETKSGTSLKQTAGKKMACLRRVRAAPLHFLAEVCVFFAVPGNVVLVERKFFFVLLQNR